MASSSGSAAVHYSVTTPEYRNWLSLGHALITVLCRGLRPFVRRELQSFYNNITAAMATIHAGPCMCVHISGRKPNPYHDVGICKWANILQGHHISHKPNWKQSDSAKWLDLNLGPWEIAKLYIPDLGGHANVKNENDMDITGLLNLMYWCKHFAVQRPLIKNVRELRNNKWVHVTTLELTEPDKKDAFDTIEALLQDPELAHDPDAQEALREVVNLKCVTDLHNFEAQVLSNFKELAHNNILKIKKEQQILRKESARNQKQRSRLEGRLRKMQTTLQDVERKMKANKNIANVALAALSLLCDLLVKWPRCVKRGIATTWITFLLLFSCINTLEHRSYKDGCPEEDISVPFDTKEFNLTDYLTTASENFVGRQWLYRDLENLLYQSGDIPGVLIIGDPGTGKSALSAQLVCSRTSSPLIHSRILGYHLCKYSDKNTQIAGKFVRNLAEMIARRLPEYGYQVSNSSYIQRSLNTDCLNVEDPVGCFEQAILTPLRNLKNRPKGKWFIVLDALDECRTRVETSHSIIYVLNNKLSRFPSWLKLVITSRNESNISLRSNYIKEVTIDPEDSRNLDDIELFLHSRFYQDGPLLYTVRRLFGDDSVRNTAKLISALLSKSQGNFLFVKEMLHQWEISRQYQSDPYALPKTLGELYHSYFQRLYDSKEKFKPVRRVLEFLVATFEPIKPKQIFEMLKMKEPNLEEEYDFKERMQELGHFLRYGENGSVTLYHLSLAEWLTSDSNMVFYVSKKKGHEAFCDYYFRLISTGGKQALSRYILDLAQHIAYGGWKETYVQQFLNFPSQTVNSTDPQNNRTLLHLAATINSTDVLKLLLRHFSCIDCVDDRGITPAFLAAVHGLVENVALFVKRGARVNLKTNSLIFYQEAKVKEIMKKETWSEEIMEICHETSHQSILVLEAKSSFWDSTMLHAASQGGHLEVVRFLLDNGAFISTVNGVQLTALQLAAMNGHFDVVKTLHESGATLDQIALYHATANNRLDVVKYLLNAGVQDSCLRCDGGFYWLKKGKYRLQSILEFVTVEILSIIDNCTRGLTDTEMKRCIDQGRITVDPDLKERDLFDDKHLILCETPLHAAVGLGFKEIVLELLSRERYALPCHDYTGRTPLHEAVRKNGTELVRILLENRGAWINSKCRRWQHISQDMNGMLSIEESIEYHQDICHCGYTPLHLAARYGYTDIGILLLRNGAGVNTVDCNGASPLHVAACHDHPRFVSILIRRFGAEVDRRTLNGSTPLHSAAICGALEVIDFLLYYGANINAVDKDGLTALHYAILNINSSLLDLKVLVNDSCSLCLGKINRDGRLVSFFMEEKEVKNTNRYRWLNTFIKLCIRGSDINAMDKNGRTALHIAASNGLADVVNVLLQRNATTEARDSLGKTPLEVAIENATSAPKELPFFLGQDFDDLRQALRDHEMVVHLLLSSGVKFKKCEHRGDSLLHRAIVNRQPYSAQLLLIKGASLKCKDKLGRTPLLSYLQNEGDWTDAVLRHFNVSISIKCGKPFNVSVIHLLSYRSPTLEGDNFFECKTCDDKLSKGPVIKAIERHPLKYGVIDKCKDAEGFTPLHRAAQGANIVAVRNYLSNGANTAVLSPQGHDALTLAVLHAGSNIWPLFYEGNENYFRVKEASNVALLLLHHIMKTHGYRIRCDPRKSELTVYHLAASRGLVDFIEQLLIERESHQLDVDCPNKDGITPLYLAKIFENQVKYGEYNPWDHVVRIIENNGGRLQYPNRDAELNVIYNRLLGWIPEKLTLNVRPDIQGFVLGLVETYKSVQNKIEFYQPNATTNSKIEIGDPASTPRIFQEMRRQRRPIIVFNGAIFLCVVSTASSNRESVIRLYILNHFVRLNSVLSKRLLGLSRKVNLRRVNTLMEHSIRSINRFLFHQMRLWYNEVFKKFSRIKELLHKARPCFSDAKTLDLLIQRYEKSIPLWHLMLINFQFKDVFRLYIHNNIFKCQHIGCHLFHFRAANYFLRDRIGWTSDHNFLDSNSWPLDFIAKFFLGAYRSYGYLNVLNVGLEQKTYITLHSDKMRQLLWKAISLGSMPSNGTR